MLGILVLLALSWLLLRFIAKEDLNALGFLALAKNAKYFAIGFMITTVLCFGYQWLEAYLRSAQWQIRAELSLDLILEALFYDFKSVLTEELVFRGALLYLVIRYFGTNKGVLLSALCFGVYHWFSYGVLGNPLMMLFVFLGTGLMGYAWAWAIAKTGSILLPFGFHLGWNMTYNTLFSKGPLGLLIMELEGRQPLSQSVNLFYYLLGSIGIPILLLLFLHFFVPKSEN